VNVLLQILSQDFSSDFSVSLGWVLKILVPTKYADPQTMRTINFKVDQVLVELASITPYFINKPAKASAIGNAATASPNDLISFSIINIGKPSTTRRLKSFDQMPSQKTSPPLRLQRLQQVSSQGSQELMRLLRHLQTRNKF